MTRAHTQPHCCCVCNSAFRAARKTPLSYGSIINKLFPHAAGSNWISKAIGKTRELLHYSWNKKSQTTGKPWSSLHSSKINLMYLQIISQNWNQLPGNLQTPSLWKCSGNTASRETQHPSFTSFLMIVIKAVSKFKKKKFFFKRKKLKGRFWSVFRTKASSRSVSCIPSGNSINQA